MLLRTVMKSARVTSVATEGGVAVCAVAGGAQANEKLTPTTKTAKRIAISSLWSALDGGQLSVSSPGEFSWESTRDLSRAAAARGASWPARMQRQAQSVAVRCTPRR